MRWQFSIFIFIVFCSCASYKTKYSKQAVGWQHEHVAANGTITHTMYLVGDAGNDMPGHPAPVLQYLQKQLQLENKQSSIVFLGDNIYEYGMPPKDDDDRQQAEFRILSQLKILDSFRGRPVFIPGNHDWRGWGVKGLKRQEKFVQKYLNELQGVNDKDDWIKYFLPGKGCSGVEVVEMNDDVVLLVIDSEWWLHDWDKQPGINDGCEVKNRAAFKFAFENIIRKYRNKQVVVAMHHPLFTYGPHGGGYSAKQHFFPLTDINKDLYLPLPVIGTLAAGFRSTIGSRQDVANRHYRELKSAILSAAKKNGKFIFAAGHEHTLQFIQQDSQSIIVSGSGSKTSPVRLGKGAQFGSGHAGYSTISFYDNGDMLVQFFEVDSSGEHAQLVFKKELSKPKLAYTASQESFDFYNNHEDSIYQTLNKEKVSDISGLAKLTLGEHYRDLYMPEYRFPVLDLEKFKGGVTPVKLGGGNQTNSLRVEGENGRDYVLRGLDKEVTRFLPFPFNRISSAKYLVKNNFLSTHPFAPLTVASLANAVDVYHTNPALYYVPAQPALGDYNAVFGNVMALVEERPSGNDWENADYFGRPKKIVGTDDMLENLLEDNKYKVDEAWALRSRLLDWIVGDWDRHDDQWQWAAIELDDGRKIYRPIPRDRDQAFSKYDGWITRLAGMTLPFLRQLQVYGPTIASRKWNTWSARLFDRSFLHELTWPQWEEQVLYIQQRLTDSVIHHAFDTWPLKARELTQAHIEQSIRARRDALASIARSHYEFVNHSVDVPGTDEKERFIVTRVDDGHTAVRVVEISKDGIEKKENYYRLFENNITQAVNLYGIGSGDEFIVRGKVNKGITVRLIGGQGKDLFVDSSSVQTGLRKTLIYDDLRENTVYEGPETIDRRTSRYQFNIYDRRDYASEYDILMPMPIIGFNPDDGFLLGAKFDLTKYGFKKEPYKSRQLFGGAYAFNTQSVQLQYAGDFISTFGKLDFFLAAHYHGPNYAFNFAGVGNETKRPIDDPDYYRVRQSEIFLYPAIKKRFGMNGFASLGPFFQMNEIEATANRFITDSAGVKDEIFDRKYFSGGRLLFDFNSLDNISQPHSGIKFTMSFYYVEALQSSKQFSTVRSSFSFYTSLDRNENLILASQLGTGLNFGSGYEFFQLPSIGGNNGIRGYRTERFYGARTFWHSTDLRIRFGSSYNTTLPFTLGLFGGFDYGRVWDKNYPSDQWHYDYGGGIWLAPVDLLTLCVGVFIPKEPDEEKPRISFKLGFHF